MTVLSQAALHSCPLVSSVRPHHPACSGYQRSMVVQRCPIPNSLRSARGEHFLSGAKLTPTRHPPKQAHKRCSTTVQAGLFDRATRVGKGYTFFYGDAAVKSFEDPRKLLDQAVSEMREDLVKMRQAAAEVMSTQKMLETKYRQAQASADQWYRRAELALGKGEDDLARDALRRKQSFSENAAMLKKQLEQHTRATSQLMTNIRVMESKVTEALSKKETLKARALSAETTKQLNESITSMVSGLKSSTSGSLAAFERMEQRVVAMEAEAEAAGQLSGSDALESKFVLLEGGFGGIDDDFQKMKSDMAASGRLDKKQPASKPTTIYWTTD